MTGTGSRRLTLLLGLTALVPGWGQTVTAPNGTAVAGQWQPKPIEGLTNGGWTYADGHFYVEAGGPRAWRWLVREEPMPEGDWTLTAGLFCAGDGLYEPSIVVRSVADPKHRVTVKLNPSANGEVDVGLYGIPKPVLLAEAHLPQAHALVEFVRLTYARRTQQLSLWVNGAPVPLKLPAVELPDELQAAVSVMGMGQPELAGRLDLFELRTQPRLVPLEEPPGVALRGWRSAPKPGSVSEAVTRRVTELSRDPAASAGVRAEALATRMILERAAGKVSELTWAEARATLAALNGAAAESGLRLLIVAAASLDDQRAAQTRPLAHALLGSLDPRTEAANRSLVEAALIDPAAAVEAAARSRSLSKPWWFAVADAIGGASPELAAGVSGSTESGANSADPLPWLAYWANGSPALFLPAVEGMRYVAEHPAPSRNPDRLACAAVALAPLDPERAEGLARAVTYPRGRALMWEQMWDAAPSDRWRQVWLPKVKEAWQAYQAAWQPTEFEPGPTRRHSHLVEFLLRAGDAEGAKAAAQAGLEAMAKSPRNRIFDRVDMAAAADRAGLPEAAALWDQLAKDVAEFEDHDTERPVAAGDKQQPTALMDFVGLAWKLAECGRFDRVDKLLDRFDPDRIPKGFQDAVALVIEAQSKLDPVGAAKRAVDLAPGLRRGGVLKKLCPALAAKDPAGALTLAEELTTDRAATRLAVLQAAGRPWEPDLREAWAAMVTEQLKPETTWWKRNRRLRALDSLTPEQLLAIEPAFVANRALFARHLLHAVATAVGLRDDPLWRRLESADRFNPNRAYLQVLTEYPPED